MRAKAKNALGRRKERAYKNRGELRRRGRGRGKIRRKREGAKEGCIGERNRRGERIFLARAIPSKDIHKKE
jgi:hypothetical protein